MTPAQAATALYSALGAWTTTPLYFDNEAHDGAAAHVRVVFNPETGDQATLGRPGQRRFVRSGRILAMVRVPSDTGQQTALEYAHDIAALVEGKTIGDVHCHAASIRPAGGDGLWYQVTVDVPVTFYETK